MSEPNITSIDFDIIETVNKSIYEGRSAIANDSEGPGGDVEALEVGDVVVAVADQHCHIERINDGIRKRI